MKKILFIITIFFLLLTNTNALEINSSNAILYNLNNNEIIYEKNSEEVIKIASLTKIMTTIVAIENIDNLNNKVVITDEMLKGLIEQNASVAGFEKGDIVTYEDLLYAAFLPSGADATQALAISISGSVSEFVNLMNKKASELNLTNTYFTNTTGLDDDNNHSTVKDVSTMLKYALQNETFKKIFQTRYYTTSNGKKLVSTIEYTSNKYKLDTSHIKGAKTGTTSKAGLCLASIASYNNIDYLLVTAGADKNLNKPLNIIDSNNVYTYFFTNYNYYNIINKDNVLLTIDNKYSKNKIELTSNIDYSMYMLKEEYDSLKYEYVGLNEIDIFTKENIIGKYHIILNDEIIKTIDIYKPDKMDFSIFQFIYNYLYIFIPITLIFVLLICFKIREIRLK